MCCSGADDVVDRVDEVGDNARAGDSEMAWEEFGETDEVEVFCPLELLDVHDEMEWACCVVDPQ